MELIKKYFPDISEEQLSRLQQLSQLYYEWNEKINVISRKDIENLYLHHVLHSLSIAKLISFYPGTAIMDVGTGGGFPGIPLAILFPDSQFYLIDSIGKKITVVNKVTEALRLDNVVAEQKRAEEVTHTFDFIISRAVTNLYDFIKMVRKNIGDDSKNNLTNGILYLKGDEAQDEVKKIKCGRFVFDISQYFSEPYFETKKIVYLYNL